MSFFGNITRNGQIARLSTFAVYGFHRSERLYYPPGRLKARQKRFWGFWSHASEHQEREKTNNEEWDG
jgi:hypothetical protein